MTHGVFVVDDHAIVRDGFRFLLSAEPDLYVCGEAGSVTEALSGIEDADPDLVVADLSLEGTSGLELIKHLAVQRPELPVLVVSMHDEMLYAERVLRAGARGYIMKESGHDELVDAIRQILRGGLYLSPRMNKKMLLQYTNRRLAEELSPVERLTDRELETFELLGRGCSTREAAEAMHISPKTAGTYRRRIKEKLALDNGAELIQRAVQWVQQETRAT